MKLQFGRAITFFVGLGFAILVCSAQAQDSTSLYIAHAAPGRNVSAITDPALPVDISIEGVCVVKGESFGDIVGPFSLPPETVSFRISTANALDPCTNSPIFSASVTFAAGTYVGGVSIDAANHVIGRTYLANLSPISATGTRALVVNATLTSLSATVTSTPTTDGTGGQFAVPPESIKAAAPPQGSNFTSIYLAGTNTLEAGPVRIETETRNVYIYVLAGSATNHSVQLIGPKVIGDVI